VSRSSPILEARGVSRSFGAIQALDSIDVQIMPGEVHAVLGENGAGKSTLMNIFGGFLAPESGDVLVDSVPAPSGSPRAMRKLGVALVHQHFMLVPEFTVAENLALDQMSDLVGSLEMAEPLDKARRQAGDLGWEIDFDAMTRQLRVGEQQRVEILKALCTEAKIIILDEPTAVLSKDEISEFVRIVRALRDSGKTIVLIAHKLSEVFAMADYVTVLRGGRIVHSGPIGEQTDESLAQAMVGDPPALAQRSLVEAAGVILRADEIEVKSDRGNLAVRSASLEVRSGEILGLGGVDGNGQIELGEALAGIRPASGVIERPKQIAYLPQDRHKDGLVLSMPLWENLLIGQLDSDLFAFGVLKRSAALHWAADVMDEYEVKAESVHAPARSLSGGNQQKVLAGRTLSQHPGVIIAVNPTRGLDVRAAAFVHDRLLQARQDGAAVLLISTDWDELAALADRTLFMSRGKLQQELLGDGK
jgi:simple sugar transport system ATP-binding protein